MSNDIIAAAGNELARPDFLNEVAKADYGVDALAQHVQPPFIKTVQDNSKEPYSVHDSGSVLAVPLNILLFKPRQQFHITPIFFYEEFVLTNPFTLKHLSFIRERSFDPTSVLARRCRDFSNREMVCPEAPADKQGDSKYMCVHHEHLNFICIIWEHDVFRANPIVLTFRSGEFKTGKKLAGLIRMRQAPIYACRFVANTNIHSVSGNENWGFDFNNPDPSVGGMSPWVEEENFKKLQEMHLDFKRVHEEGRLQTGLDEEQRAPADATEDAPAM